MSTRRSPLRSRRWTVATAVFAATAAGLTVAGPAGPALGAAAAPSTSSASSTAGAADWLPPTPDQWPLVVDETVTPDRTLTRGVRQHADLLQTVGGAQRAQVLDVDLADPNVRLGVVESHDHLTDTADEVPSSMAHRTGAVAGVNGDFFQIYASGRPLGMVVIDGRLVKSPDPAWNADLWVRHDGSIGIGSETYTGTVTDGATGAGAPISTVNAVDALSGNALVRVTPDLGTPSPIPASTVAAGHLDRDGTTLVVDSVTAGVTDLAQLAPGTEELAGSGTRAQWLAQNVHVGDRLAVSEQIGPDSDVVQGLSGGAVLVRDGRRAVPLTGPGENNVDNPVTAVGVTQDGEHAVFAAFDGHQPEDTAQGLTRPQIAGWMMQHGAYNAILFDSGGSTQMVGRLSGQTQASVLNVPSDGHERPVANGLFIYSTEKSPGPAVQAVVTDTVLPPTDPNRPLTALAGTTVPVSAYGLDSRDNPARDAATLKISPPWLASVNGSTLIVGSRPGSGVVHVTAGHAHTVVPLTVVPALKSLTVTPNQADLDSGGTQQITAAATAADGSAVALPASAVQWTVDPPALGTVAADGTFTAASQGSGMVTVTARAGGRSATVSIAVGRSTVGVDALADISKWSVTDAYMNVYPRKVPSPGSHSSNNGALSFDPGTKAFPGDAGSFDVHYNYPYVSKTLDLSVYLNDPESEQIPLLNGTQAPIGIGVWVKGNPDLASRPGAGLAPGIVTLNVGIWQSTNQPTSFYPTGVTFDGWQYVVAKLPPGLQYPLRINYLGLVVIKPGPNLTGDIHLADLQAVYSPRPPVPPVYTPIPKNPSWLQFSDVGSFKPGGTTIAAFDDAHVTAANPAGTGSVALNALPGLLANLPAPAKPAMVQALGDMADDGQTADLTYLKGLFDGLGVPYHDAVGNHEITQGATPENGDFGSVFGATHYAYDQGAARVIVTDSGHIGITASDPYQNVDTDRSQYLWLADQLTRNTQKVAIVTTHVPAYDPHPRADSQFSDRFEARMYEQLVQRYQKTHPGVHVLMLFGHARGWAEDVRWPDGSEPADGDGIPNFVVADLGATPYAPVDQGGFYNYGLFDVQPDGTVQFAVQPLLASVAVTAPASALAVGGTEQLTATGTSLTGGDAAALRVPIADPASRHWESSDPAVASVDPASGAVTAHSPGSVTVTVTTGGVSGSASITVR